MSMNPRWTFRKDGALQLRMYFVMFMLAALYLFFITVMFGLGVPIEFVIVIAAVMLGIQWFGSDKIVLRAMNAKLVTPEEQPKLHAMVDRLVERAEMPKPKVAIAMTDVPNAFATGRNQQNALVCVTDGIVKRLDDGELEGVIAHELMHRRLAEYGGEIDAVFVCLCLPRYDCECFRPRASMLHEIAERLHVSLGGVPCIGGTPEFLETALGAGARPIRVRTGRRKARTRGAPVRDEIETHDDLAAAVDALLAPS